MMKPMYLRFKVVLVFIAFNLSQVHAQHVDINLLDKLNPSARSADKTFKFVSDKAIITTTAAPFALYLAGTLAHDDQLKKNALHTGIALASTSLLTHTMKRGIQRARPFDAFPERIVHKGGGEGYSFPSGHTSSAFAFATSMSLSYPKWYVIVPSFAFASVTAYSRMYMGVHYPSDVLGGAIVGAGTSYLTWKLQKSIQKKRARKKPSY